MNFGPGELGLLLVLAAALIAIAVTHSDPGRTTYSRRNALGRWWRWITEPRQSVTLGVFGALSTNVMFVLALIQNSAIALYFWPALVLADGIAIVRVRRSRPIKFETGPR